MAKKYRPLNSILVKPTGPDCNLNCTYCFYLEKAELFKEEKVHRMSEETLEEMVRQVMQQSGDSVSFGWQGGEPTQMGIDFFQKAIDFEIKYGHGQAVGNGLQTNGLLLNKDWAKFLKKYDWLVGLSLDGPQHIHDKYRFDKAGKGTWERVQNNAKMLLEEGVSVNAMCCITDYSSQFPEELYQYYKDMGLNFMQFIPIVETDKDDPTQAAPFSLDPVDYGNFMIKLFDLWIADFKDGQPTTSIRFFESIFHSYVGMEAPECALMKECGAYVVVEHNGNVYSCDFFVEPKFKLGNIRYDRIVNMMNSKRQQTFGAAKANVSRKCRMCEWYTKCYGGCTKDRIKDPQDNKQPRFCTAYKMIFKHVDPIMRSMAEQWKQQQLQNQQAMKAQQQGGTYNAFEDFVK